MSPTDLDSRIDTLRAADAVPGPLLDTFAGFLADAPEEELFRMSPLRWAAQRGVAEQAAIDLFLHATHAGLLEFAWGLLCPGCLAFMTTPGALRSVRKRHCGFCSLDLECTIDDRVEVAFTVAPSVRRIRFHSPETVDLLADAPRLYFSSSLMPESVPHQAFAKSFQHAGRVRPGEQKTVAVTLAAKHSVVMAPASHTVFYMHTSDDDGGGAVTVELFDGRAMPNQMSLPRGPVEITVVNRMARTAGYVVGPVEFGLWPGAAAPGERIRHPFHPYLTGPRLLSSQVFRDLFRAESLPSEGGLELKEVTLLFTDLKGSTTLYERMGDLRAYDLVRRHFAVLRDVVAEEGGALVKTIGDAIMASFAEPTAAMRAALRMSRALEQVGEEQLLVKIGVHTGPAIAVDLNDRLDYFGRTVNIAARVQGITGPGEIVCTDVVYEAPEVRALVEEAGYEARQGRVPLRGIEDEVAVVRLRG